MTTKLLVLLAFASIALLVACDNGDGGEVAPTVDVTPAVTPVETPVETPTVEPEVCQPNPDPATPEFQVIDQPSAGDTVTSPVTISGQVEAYEATYQVGIFDADGDPIVETFGTAEARELGELAPFSIDVEFEVDEPTPACIWVYEQSVRDGSSIHVGQIPVTLSPTVEPEVCQPNPDPATPEFQIIDQPSAGDTVTSPVTISGQVAAFEATYLIGIFDADGDPIVETFGTAEAREIGELAPFSIDVTFEVDEPTPACIWVYEQSMRDGSSIHVGQIPVTLSP